MTDPIADLLTRIRNGYAAHHDEVMVPHSRMKDQIVNVMVTHGYIAASEVTEKDGIKMLHLTLKYIGRSPVLTNIQRISSPGRRIYSTAKSIKPVLAGNGIRIISTSKGIMVDADARAQNIGGEVICKIW